MHGWKTQFLEAFPTYADEEYILHGRYHLTGTVTGRLSTSAPNMQNMPRSGPVRSCLVHDSEGITAACGRQTIRKSNSWCFAAVSVTNG